MKIKKKSFLIVFILALCFCLIGFSYLKKSGRLTDSDTKSFETSNVSYSNKTKTGTEVMEKEQKIKANNTASKKLIYSQSSTVNDVVTDLAFGNFGYLLFPVDRSIDRNMTLAEISTSDVYIWYNYIRADKTVEIINHLKGRANKGKTIFFSIYTASEIAKDSSKKDTGLFYFGGEKGMPFAIMNAGGGFMYVGAMHDSFPHALAASQLGYNSFALIYRPHHAYEDLAQAIKFIYDHAEELGVDRNHYSLWGGSAGARMAATLGNEEYLRHLTGRKDIPQADAVIMQYTGYNSYSPADAPTYACVGTSDSIASAWTMQSRLQALERLSIPTEFHSYPGLPHGFGLGTGTNAEGWFNDAIAFWKAQTQQRKKSSN
ncbi:MAG: alpha/beta hydrolase [Phascolarctobacterium sp.]|nr:alpha/beta hydrolase [Phascolarctobacterium sp.]